MIDKEQNPQIECVTLGSIKDPISLDVDKFKEYLTGLYGGSFDYYKQTKLHYKLDKTEVLLGKGIRVLYHEDGIPISKIPAVRHNESLGYIESTKSTLVIPQKIWEVDYIGYRVDEIQEENKYKILVFRNESSISNEDPGPCLLALGYTYPKKFEDKIEMMKFTMNGIDMCLTLILTERKFREDIKQAINSSLEKEREINSIKIIAKGSKSQLTDMINTIKNIIIKLSTYAKFYQDFDEKVV